MKRTYLYFCVEDWHYLYWPIGLILEILTVKELEVPTYLLDSDVFN